MNKLIYILSILTILISSCKKEIVILENISVKGGEKHKYINNYKTPEKYNYIWDFGDGNTSTEINPTHAYIYPGNYFVSVSKYNKNGIFLSNQKLYYVKVKQLYRPDIHAVKVYTDNYDYNYKNRPITMYINLSENQSYKDYTYKLIVDNSDEYTQQRNDISFADTGNHNLQFTLTDNNNISTTFDTTIFVGDTISKINLKVPNTFESQLGTITEKYIIFNDDDSYHNYNLEDIENYPNTTNNLLRLYAGEYQIYRTYGSGYYNYTTAFFDPLKLVFLQTIENNTYIQEILPASDWASYYSFSQEYDEIYVIVVLIGTNGKAYGGEKLEIIPGTVSNLTIDLSFSNY